LFAMRNDWARYTSKLTSFPHGDVQPLPFQDHTMSCRRAREGRTLHRDEQGAADHRARAERTPSHPAQSALPSSHSSPSSVSTVRGPVLGSNVNMLQDTSRAGLSRYHQLLRAQQPYERLAQAAALTRMVRELAEAGIRQRHPSASEAEVRVRLTVRLYGRETAQRLFRHIPEDAV
jgi:hypothetical protein